MVLLQWGVDWATGGHAFDSLWRIIFSKGLPLSPPQTVILVQSGTVSPHATTNDFRKILLKYAVVPGLCLNFLSWLRHEKRKSHLQCRDLGFDYFRTPSEEETELTADIVWESLGQRSLGAPVHGVERGHWILLRDCCCLLAKSHLTFLAQDCWSLPGLPVHGIPGRRRLE